MKIHVTVTNRPPAHGVDTEEDLARVDALLRAARVEGELPAIAR
jgi:CMP-2-keto-3-deoxyoctulosonic acid synthetase